MMLTLLQKHSALLFDRVAVVQAPESASACGGLSVDASMSSGSGGNVHMLILKKCAWQVAASHSSGA